jgi:hypothetical protein
MPPLALTGGSVVMSHTVPTSPLCYGTCCATLALWRPPSYYGCLYHEFVRGGCEVHLDILPHPSHLSCWLGTLRPWEMTSTTRWRGLPTRPSRSSMSDTCRTPLSLLLPCSPSKMRETRLGVDTWPPPVTPRDRPITRVEHSLHAMPACELPTPGGHDSWHLPEHAPRGL